MYNLKIITSGKRVEIYKINGYTVGNKGENMLGNVFKENNGRRGNEDTPEDKKKFTSEIERAKTLNNARNNIIRLIKANEEDLKVFITLTFAVENDYKSSKKLLNNFFNKLRRDYKDLKYIWILEYGEQNGRLHYHILCNIPINIKLSRTKEKKSQEHKDLENDFKNRYWNTEGCGWVFIRKLRDEGCDNVALYVAAYITKDLLGKQLEGYRIYGYSRKTLNKPIEEKIYTTESLETIIEGFKDTYDITYTNSYEIGYKTDIGDYKGIVLYMDLIQKED